MEAIDRELCTPPKKSMPSYISQVDESTCRFNRITLMIARKSQFDL